VKVLDSVNLLLIGDKTGAEVARYYDHT
jgi:hypothetical protein